MTDNSNQPFNDLAIEIHADNIQAGWWNLGDRENPHVIATKICLIHSEVSEMMEGVRKGLQDDKLPHRKMAEVEAADVLIRLLDLAASQGWDLDGAIAEKREFNARCEDHKIENRNAAGGKAY